MVKVPPAISSNASLPSLAYTAKKKGHIKTNEHAYGTYLLSQRRNLLLDLHESHGLHVPHHRGDQSLWRGDSHAEIDVISVNNLITFDGRVRGGDLLQGEGTRPREGAHEAELYILLFEDGVFIPVPHVDQRRHVDLVECP